MNNINYHRDMSDNPYIDKAIQVLKLSPLKITSQRLLLIEILFKNGNNHYTAEDVHKEVEKKKYKISLATIYNCLNQFTHHGILKSVKVSSDKIFFDTNTDIHHHFFCKNSEKLTDIKFGDIVISHLPKPPEGKKLEAVEVVVNIKD